ncbi:MAG: hypothetical protein KGL95_00360, partial [Patescibacteria group bacterium]|nr:hypothetical protein [Patescibacteria group bacterium]
MDKRFIFNIDETAARSVHDSKYKAIVERLSPHHSQLISKGDTLTSIVPIVSADGGCWMIVYIYKSGKDSKTLKKLPFVTSTRHTRLNWPILYCRTRTGQMNGTLWHSIAESFAAIVRPHLRGSIACLFCDSLTSHTSLNTLRLLLTNDIHVVLFPPHTTSVLQPLDDAVFASLK